MKNYEHEFYVTRKCTKMEYFTVRANSMEEAKEEAEMQKEIAKQQKIANDKHGRGRFIAPDILTQAAIEERQQQHNENYNLNQNRFR